MIEVRIYYPNGYMVPSRYWKHPPIHHPSCVIVSPLDARTVDDIKDWLTTPKGLPSERRPNIDQATVESILQSLSDQIKKCVEFPNAMVFLDIDGKPMTMDVAIPKCSRCKAWCGRTCY